MHPAEERRQRNLVRTAMSFLITNAVADGHLREGRHLLIGGEGAGTITVDPLWIPFRVAMFRR